jgi:hypothetical protein
MTSPNTRPIHPMHDSAQCSTLVVCLLMVQTMIRTTTHSMNLVGSSRVVQPGGRQLPGPTDEQPAAAYALRQHAQGRAKGAAGKGKIHGTWKCQIKPRSSRLNLQAKLCRRQSICQQSGGRCCGWWEMHNTTT